MAISLKHAFISAKGDGPDASIVRPSNWNAEHPLTLTGPAVVGKPNAGNGPAVEIPAGALGLQILGCPDVPTLNAIVGTLPTGAVMMYLPWNTPAGWVVANGTTIGDALSAASQLKDPKTWALFNLLYIYFNDTLCPVTPGGRSGNALNDFNAHKAIRVPDLRGRQLVGDDVMQNVAANVLPGATTGQTGGAATHAIAVANLPAAAIPISGSTDQSGSHAHTYDRTSRTAKTAASGSGVTINEADPPTPNNTGTTGLHIHPFTGATANLGSGTALPTMDPYFVLSFYIKL